MAREDASTGPIDQLEDQQGLVAIAGAGFAGLALACTLLRAGRPVVILERHSRLPTGGAAVAIQANGLAALDRLGVLQRAVGAGSRIDRMLMHDRRGRRVACVDFGELDCPHPFFLSVRRRELLRVLADELAHLGGGSLLYGAEVVGLIRRGDAVRGLRYRREGEEAELSAWCVAGADGIRSAVARELGIAVRSWGRDQRYVVGIGARPVRLKDGCALIHHGTGYADGVMPLGEHAYFYDSVTADNRSAVEAGDLDGWRAVYARRVPEALELTEGIASWDELSVFGAQPSRAARRAADGAALLGDAAAVVHPHSAQGANLALDDGVALGDLLAKQDPTRALRLSDLLPYQRERGAKAMRYVAWSRLAGWTFDGETALARTNRWLGWQWMRLGPARRVMLRQGAGLF
jgi:2-polyprenyl-6-methoxyphenol hydroxylase-like FAD-dependent oxidoreductase